MSNKTIQEYFLDELQSLDEGMQMFAQQHPNLARMIGVDGQETYDPNVRRLLEGSAYLQARVKQQIDLGLHQISEALLQQIAPDYLAPRPSQCIVGFSTPRALLTKKEVLPAGVKLASSPVGEEGTVCEFKTTKSMVLYPFTITSIEIGQSEQPFLKISFQFNEGVDPTSIKIDDLNLYINANVRTALQWYHYLTQHVSSIKLKENNREDVIYKKDCIKGESWINSSTDTLLKHTKKEAFSLLNDFFHFPERFLFLKLQQLYFTPLTTRFEMVIQFSKPLPNLSAHEGLFKLHCVPAINLFTGSCEPIRLEKHRTRYPLILCHQKKESLRLSSLKTMHAVKKNERTPVLLTNFFELGHYSQNKLCYRLSQLHQTQDSVSTYVTFSGDYEEDMYISCDAELCNAYYPESYLSVGSLFLKEANVSVQVEATNVTKPSRFFHPVFTESYANAVLAGVHMPFQRLEDVSFLKKRLRQEDHFKQFTVQIDTLKSIECKPFNRLRQGLIEKGITCSITMQASPQVMREQMSFFGAFIHHYMKLHAPLNTFIETTLKMMPSNEYGSWSV